MKSIVSVAVAAACALAACGGGAETSPGGSGGSSETSSGASSGSSETSSGSSGVGGGGAPPDGSWQAGLVGSCDEIGFVALGPEEDGAIAVQKIAPPLGKAATIHEFTITLVRIEDETGGPYALVWAVGTNDGIADTPAVFGEQIVEEDELSWKPANGAAAEVATATITFNPPLPLAPGEIFYPGLRLQKHGGPPALASAVVTCTASTPAEEVAQKGQESYFSTTLPDGTSAQCPGQCSLTALSAFPGLDHPLLIEVLGTLAP